MGGPGAVHVTRCRTNPLARRKLNSTMPLRRRLPPGSSWQWNKQATAKGIYKQRKKERNEKHFKTTGVHLHELQCRATLSIQKKGWAFGPHKTYTACIAAHCRAAGSWCTVPHLHLLWLHAIEGWFGIVSNTCIAMKAKDKEERWCASDQPEGDGCTTSSPSHNFRPKVRPTGGSTAAAGSGGPPP